MRIDTLFFVFILLFAGISCQQKERPDEEASGPQFTQLDPTQTNVQFVNALPEGPFRNILRYQYYYNGGGVAIGDVNGDELPDICFSANTAPPKLYLNKGNMQFEDVSERAGLSIPGKVSWNTGISMADVNGDGHLDIYLCRSGNLQAENRSNLLYINRGDGTFSQQAALYGLNDPGYSIQAAFFDYDKDGDLDLFLINHGINFYGRDPQGQVSDDRDRMSGDKLYRNDGQYFTDVTQSAGILERAFSYGLGVGIGDLDQDGWDDIYVSNDFFEHDYLYWNQGDGTFKEGVRQATQQLSYFGMGNDLVDVNNDALLDIIVLDMAAEDHYRRMANLAGLSYEKFWEFVDKGYYYQYMYNSLNVNNGNRTFSNYAQLAGIAQTDWSWAPLVADFDNDGLKDIYITNGLRKDVLNLDFINNIDTRFAKYAGPDGQLPPERFKELLESMPSEKVLNYCYRNTDGLQFENVTESWGISQASFSTGAAYADLDGDGDLDIVVNNIDEPAFIYRNEQDQKTENNYLRLAFKGAGKNTYALGARVKLITSEGEQYQQLYTSRGYQSSVEPILHFGLKTAEPVQLEVTWPDGQITAMKQVEVNRSLTLPYEGVNKQPPAAREEPQPLFENVTAAAGLAFTHRENAFEDFKREFLLPHKMSTLGPPLSVADVDGDGKEDFFIGGALGQAGSLYRQTAGGRFEAISGSWNADKGYEDTGSCFFDADGDGDADLYLASGGNERDEGDEMLQDRLYLNEGAGQYSKAEAALPDIRISSSCARAADFDQDGQPDLFVGGRQLPGRYPMPASSFLLKNDGGRFEEVSENALPALKDIGMVTDALWMDLDGDGYPGLIIAGEWMNLRFFKNEGGQFTEITEQTGLGDLTGWYFSLAAGDFDGDGDMDLLAGNLGLNHRFQASPDSPFEIFASDFDNNGSLDIVPAYHQAGKRYPLYGRNVMQEQLVMVKKKYPNYGDYAKATVADIFGQDALDEAYHRKATNFASLYIENKGKGQFEAHPLPTRAQASAIHDFVVRDVNADGQLDVLLAGNIYNIEYRTARADAGVGLLLLGNGDGSFEPAPTSESGFYAPGNVKALAAIDIGGQPGILVGKNDGPLQLLKARPSALK